MTVISTVLMKRYLNRKNRWFFRISSIVSSVKKGKYQINYLGNLKKNSLDFFRWWIFNHTGSLMTLNFWNINSGIQNKVLHILLANALTNSLSTLGFTRQSNVIRPSSESDKVTTSEFLFPLLFLLELDPNTKFIFDEKY